MKGLDALGNRIANMTIGELEAMLDLQNIDPLTVVQLMKDLRSLYRTFVSSPDPLFHHLLFLIILYFYKGFKKTTLFPTSYTTS